MRTIVTAIALLVATLFVAVVMGAVPAFAADSAAIAKPAAATPTATIPTAAAPAPPAVTYQVWGFKWTGASWVRQPNYSLQTTDLKQAADYKAQINSYAGWTAMTNLPAACYVHTVYRGPVASRRRPTQSPDKPNYSVWAYTLANGKWVKDDKYSWSTSDPAAGLAYAKQVAAVPGWSAVSNCPAPVPKAQRVVDGGMVHGSEKYAMHINLGGVSISIPYSMLRNSGAFNGTGAGSYDSSASSDNWPTNSDTSDIQNMVSTQDMLNAQQQNTDLQNDLNTQNFNNTENMINSQQEAINAQANP